MAFIKCREVRIHGANILVNVNYLREGILNYKGDTVGCFTYVSLISEML